jgi:hypothetical protein
MAARRDHPSDGDIANQKKDHHDLAQHLYYTNLPIIR